MSLLSLSILLLSRPAHTHSTEPTARHLSPNPAQSISTSAPLSIFTLLPTMSRPDAQDYADHSGYDPRNSSDHTAGGPDFGSHLRDFMPRDGLRDGFRDGAQGGARDYGAQDFGGAATFYSSSYSASTSPPPPGGQAFAADRRPTLTSNTMGGPGFPSYVGPRMLNTAHGMGMGGVGTGGSWNSKPGSVPGAFSAAATAPAGGARATGEGSGPAPGVGPPAVSSQVQQQPVVSPALVLNQHHHAHHHAPAHHRPSPTRAIPDIYTSPLLAASPPYADRDSARDAFFPRPHPQQSASPLSVQLPPAQPQSLPSPNNPTPSPRTTLWWGELEPWMDEEYAKQVCNLMGWDPISVKVPRPAPDPITGQQANNPGYCFLTFPTQAQAASVLTQVNNTTSPLIMPNSSKAFSLNWASSVPSAPAPASAGGQTISIPGVQNPQYPKEYSIFVGDLAPEVSNSDLVAVFRNPVLGLRNDREPRFIRPFLSCKSAKIMLDPVTGVSRGYGFVRHVYSDYMRSQKIC